jgi:hypothetical protein
MKIISSDSDANIGLFDVAICFKPYSRDTNFGEDNEAYLNHICQWVVDTFTGNFVILEKVETIVVGGWIDNKFGWDKHNQSVNRSEHSKTAVYELRCKNSDATAFLMKWS